MSQHPSVYDIYRTTCAPETESSNSAQAGVGAARTTLVRVMKAVGSARLRRTDVVVRLEVVVERRLYFGVSMYSGTGTGKTYSGCCANGRCGYARRSGCSACSSGGRTSRGGGWACHRGWPTGCLAIEDILRPSELILVAHRVRDGKSRLPKHCCSWLAEGSRTSEANAGVMEMPSGSCTYSGLRNGYCCKILPRYAELPQESNSTSQPQQLWVLREDQYST